MANQSHGFDVQIGIAEETTFGTAPAAVNFKSPGIVNSFEPEESMNTIQRNSIGRRGVFKLRPGAKSVEASLESALQNGVLIYAALGKVTTTGSALNGYEHTMVPVQAGEVLPSFSIEMHDDNLNLTTHYVGGKVDTMTITAAAEEEMVVSTDWIFKDAQAAGVGYPATVVTSTENYFLFYEGELDIGGNVALNVTEFEVEISNNLEPRFAIAKDKTVQRIEEGNLEISGSLTIDLTDTAEYNRFQAGSPVNITLSFVDVNDSKHGIDITLSNGVYDTASLPATAEDNRELELEVIFRDIQVVYKDLNATII